MKMKANDNRKAFDLTKQVRPNESSLCQCRGPECNRLPSPLACWLQNPTGGICPLMKGEEHDNRKK